MSVRKLAAESKTRILEYSVYLDTDSDPGRYIVLLESDREVGPSRWQSYSDILNRILCEIHDSYRQKIERKICRGKVLSLGCHHKQTEVCT